MREIIEEAYRSKEYDLSKEWVVTLEEIKYLAKSRTLNILNLGGGMLWGGSIEDMGVKEIAKSETITELELSNNGKIGDEGLEAFIGNTAIRKLIIRFTRVSNEMYKKVEKGINKNIEEYERYVIENEYYYRDIGKLVIQYVEE